MRKWAPALVGVAARVPLAACVQSRQYADMEFTPPRAITNCWCFAPTSPSARSPPAAWPSRAPTGPTRPAPTSSPRSAPSRRPAAARSDRRASQRVAGGRPPRSWPTSSGSISRSTSRSSSTNISATICRPSAAAGSIGRLAMTLSASARERATIMPCSSMPRTRSRRAAGSRSESSASPAASSAFARPMSAAPPSSITPRWSTFSTGEVVWFNVVQASSQLPGIKFGDLRTPAGRATDGRTTARPDEAWPGCSPAIEGEVALMCARCLEHQPPGAAGRRRRRGRGAWHRHRPGPHQAAGHGPADRPRLQAHRSRRNGPVEGDGAGRGGNLRLQPARPGPQADRLPQGHYRLRRRTGREGFPHLPGAHPGVQRDDVPQRLRGGFFRLAPADAQRGAAGRRDCP